ncbi:MATE family efflux transporter [Sphingobium sufflavum]|nr:MATE family efflux transporter [Sphingobium sufflavum]
MPGIHAAPAPAPAPVRTAPPVAAPFRTELIGLALFAAMLTIYELAAILNGATTTWVMGRLGTETLAAGGMVGSVLLLLYLVMQGLVQGISIVFAQSVGAGRDQIARSAATIALYTGLVLGLALTLVLTVLPAVFMTLPGEPRVHALAGRYVLGLAPGIVATSMLFAQRAVIFALQKSRMVVGLSWTAMTVNVALAYLLSSGSWGLPDLGIMGVGIASSVVAWLQLILQSALIARDRAVSDYFRDIWRPVPELLAPLARQCLTIGAPIAAVMAIEGLLVTGSYFLMAGVGAVQLAGHALAQQWMAIAFMAPIGISQAVAMRIGFRIGARDAEGAARLASAAIVLTLAVTGVIALAFLFSGDTLAHSLMGSTRAISPDSLAAATDFLGIAAIAQMMRGLIVVFAAILRGCGDVRVAFRSVIVGYWLVGLGLAGLLAFGLGLGGIGIWMGLAAGFAYSCIALSFRVKQTLDSINDTILKVENGHAKFSAIGS